MGLLFESDEHFWFCDGAIAFSAFMNEEAVRCGQVIEDNNFKLGNYSTSA
jgi:hypothetical protein